MIDGHLPVIVAMWHGQHMMITLVWPNSIKGVGGADFAPCATPARRPSRCGVSASTPVRGSGGRADDVLRKGGARALIALKR